LGLRASSVRSVGPAEGPLATLTVGWPNLKAWSETECPEAWSPPPHTHNRSRGELMVEGPGRRRPADSVPEGRPELLARGEHIFCYPSHSAHIGSAIVKVWTMCRWILSLAAWFELLLQLAPCFDLVFASGRQVQEISCLHATSRCQIGQKEGRRLPFKFVRQS
jgi:hypothetical protein